jgi:hypothetical protein
MPEDEVVLQGDSGHYDCCHNHWRGPQTVHGKVVMQPWFYQNDKMIFFQN